MRYSTLNFPKHIQREEKGSFDPGAWEGIGDATAAHEDVTQIETKSQKEEEDIEETTELDESINTENLDESKKLDEKNDLDKEDESKDKEEFDLSEVESKRIEDEIKEKSEKEGEDLEKEIKTAKKERLDSLVSKEEDTSKKRFDEKIEEVKSIKENKGKTDDEITQIANESIKEENDNPFFTYEDEESNSDEINDWKEIGKEIIIDGESINVENNTKESFQKAINDQVEVIRSENDEYNELSPDMKDMFKYINKHGIESAETWLHPDKAIEGYLKMDNDTLMETAITASRKTAEPDTEVDKEDVLQEIEDMKEDNSFAKNLRDLKTNLRVKLDEARVTVIERAKREDDKIANSKEDDINKIHGKVIEKLEGMDKFLGTYDIPKKTTTDLAKSLTPEEIKRLQSDPEFLVIAAFMRKFGPKLIKGMTESAATKSKDKSLRIRRNADEALLIRRRVSSSSSASAASESEGKEGFEKWKL